METVILAVNGMSCAACVRGVEQALNGCAGVAQVLVDLASGKAKVQFDPQQTDVAQLAAAVEAAGFDAAVAD
ncbi:cation transporter [Conchiformibius steedae DSM 2580]|uniref:Cation transporter n=1 Tax=Conchiformibius steedae DSM 2580 TaxID=1121352 RepID=A0AAE9KYI9_9NEIS|nr:heavy metal-associated domain-containing protein [Conchiformibius steedae]QMT34031.1 heavy-metal-associated domain-containing protein [Conchiformibius steedae]URD66803.1 cation transporter [Conchiformibius steedae DSM 2580]